MQISLSSIATSLPAMPAWQAQTFSAQPNTEEAEPKPKPVEASQGSNESSSFTQSALQQGSGRNVDVFV
jgi:hypothetical protein